MFIKLKHVPLHPNLEHTPIDRNAPLAPVRFVREGRVTNFEVVRCPYCGGTHEHGGVHASEGDPRRMLGGRIAHCHPDVDPPRHPEYRLVAIEGRISRDELDTYFPMVGGMTSAPATRKGIPSVVRHQVWQKTGGVCFYCGVQTTPFATFCVDHFVPVAHGGTNDLENLVPACRTCNGTKADLDIEDFRDRIPGRRFWFDGQGLG